MSESYRRDRPFLVWGGVVRESFMEEGVTGAGPDFRAHGQNAWGEVLRSFEEPGCPSLKRGGLKTQGGAAFIQQTAAESPPNSS